MKIKTNQVFLLIGALLVSGCSSQPGRISPTMIDTSTRPPVFAPTPTATQPNQADALVLQIKSELAAYNQLIQHEKDSGSSKSIDLPGGEKGLQFLGDSNQKISAAEQDLVERIGQLNDEYLALYLKDAQPAPTPMLTDRAKMSAELESLQNAYQQWSEQEIKTGDVVSIYSPETMNYFPQFIGKSYALDRIKDRQIHLLWLALNGPADQVVKQDIQQIQKLEPGEIALTDVSALPYYRADLRLAQYESATRTYILYSAMHAIIEIVPKNVPQTAALTPRAPLSRADLEQKARAFIAAVAPGTNLDGLTDAGGSKIGSFFFRWEDRTKPFLDDGMSYPFIQVGYNSDGELLNYYNTLPLAR